MGAKEDWTAKVNAKGDEIRDAKKAKAAKEAIMPRFSYSSFRALSSSRL